MKHVKVEKDKQGQTVTQPKVSKYTSLFITLALMFVMGYVIFFTLRASLYNLQKFLYQRSGEILIGSFKILTGIVCTTAALDFLFLIFISDTLSKYFPRFYYRYCYATGSNIKINIRVFKRLKLALVGILIFGACVIYIFFNEYIALGEKYIAGSSASFVNNRQEYDYYNIHIFEIRPEDSNHGWSYRYKFSDGKKIGELGFSLGGENRKLINLIQDRQRKLGLKISSVELGQSSIKQSMPAKWFSYFVWASMFLFIPWTLKRLLNKKE